MSAQFIEIAGQKMAILPVDDYRELLSRVEDQSDLEAAARSASRRAQGEEFIPAAIVDSLLSGANALKVWRKFRGFTQEQLAAKVARKKAYISKLETGRSEGGIEIWRSLAVVLDVTVEDILPAN